VKASDCHVPACAGPPLPCPKHHPQANGRFPWIESDNPVMTSFQPWLFVVHRPWRESDTPMATSFLPWTMVGSPPWTVKCAPRTANCRGECPSLLNDPPQAQASGGDLPCAAGGVLARTSSALAAKQTGGGVPTVTMTGGGAPTVLASVKATDDGELTASASVGGVPTVTMTGGGAPTVSLTGGGMSESQGFHPRVYSTHRLLSHPPTVPVVVTGGVVPMVPKSRSW